MPRIPELPDFSGTVTATDELPLYDASSDRTYGATMLDVATYVAGSGVFRATVETVSASTQTPTVGTDGRYFICTNASGCAVTIPTNAAQAFPIGTMLTYQQNDNDSVTFTPDGGVTLRVPPTYTAETAEQYAVAQIVKVGTNEWVIYGHLLPA